MPNGLPVAGEDDGVGADGGAHRPGELQVVPLRRRRLARRDDPPRLAVGGDGIGRLDEQPTVDRADVEVGAPGGAAVQDPQVRLGDERGEGVVVVARGDDDLGEHRRQRRGGSRGHRPVHRDDAAEGADRVAGVGPLVGRGDVAGDGDAARVGVLDDHARRLGEAVHEPPRGLGVEQVEVAQRLAAVLLDGVPPAGAPASR